MKLDVTYSTSCERYRLITDISQLKGTCYFEFCCGKYNEQWWSRDSVYLTDENFDFIQNCFETNCSKFEYYDYNDIPKHEWIKIIECLEKQSEHIRSTANIEDLEISKHLYSDIKEWLNVDYSTRKSLLTSMIDDLCTWVRETLKHHDYVAVLGM